MEKRAYDRGNKEVRLFGDKSIREEAYRRKILQLEKEISNLMDYAGAKEEAITDESVCKAKNLNNLYYESLMSFDVRVKKEHEFLEKRATEITERFDAHAQKIMLDIERAWRKNLKFILFSTFALIALFLLLYNYQAGIRNYKDTAGVTEKNQDYNYLRIRQAIAANTRYRHNYTVTDITFFDDTCKVGIDFNSMPADNTYIRNVAQDITKAFRTSAGRLTGEIDFTYNGKTRARALIPGNSSATQLRYFS